MKRPDSLRRMTPFALVVLLLPACSGSVNEAGDTTLAPTTTTTTTAPTTTTTVVESATTTSDVTGSEVAPFHEMPAFSVAVVGTATCIFSMPTEGLTIDCDLDLTDPRVSGTEISSGYEFFAWGKNGRAWIGDGVITNPDGTWTGSLQGAENASGSSPVGEAHYFGEGAYEGLEFHYYFMHPEPVTGDTGPVEIRGWIYESG